MNPSHNLFLKSIREDGLYSCPFVIDFHFLSLSFSRLFIFIMHCFIVLLAYLSTAALTLFYPSSDLEDSEELHICVLLQLSLFFLIETFWVVASRLSLYIVVTLFYVRIRYMRWLILFERSQWLVFC